MPRKHNVVIILDVNSIPRESPLLDNAEMGSEVGRGSTMGNTVPYKYETVKAVKEMILAILAKESLQYSTDKFNFSQVLWSFKIYNSSVEINSKTGRVFQPLETSSIEGFEKQLDSYLDLGCVSALKSEPGVNLAELLSTSLKSVLSDLPWPEPRNGNEFGAGMSARDNQHNVIYAIFRVPGTDSEVKEFIPGWTAAGGSKSVMHELLPKAFAKMMKDNQIVLNFVDMWPAVRKETEVGDWEFGDSGSKPMMKIVHYLGGGIMPLTHISTGVPLGMPSYGDLLKVLIASGSGGVQLDVSARQGKGMLLDDSQKTIKMLHGSLNGSICKASQDDQDQDEVESMRSQGGFRIMGASFALAQTQNQRRSYHELQDRERRRLSDERNNRRRDAAQDDFRKKRKFEFEDDIESEEGYSPADIENWCSMGRVGGKERERSQKLRRATISHLPDRGRSMQPPVSKYSSPHLLQPQKRMRRADQVMAPPDRVRNVTSKQQRYSDPMSISTTSSRRGDSIARGRVLLNEGLKKKKPGKSKYVAPREPVAEVPKSTFWDENTQVLNSLKNRLSMILHQDRMVKMEDPVEELKQKVNWFINMVVEDEDCCLPSTAQALVTTVGATLVDKRVLELRETTEQILVLPYDSLNLELIKNHNSQKAEATFRKCLLQIFINFEMVWTIPSKDTDALEAQFVDDVVRILSLLKIYRPSPPIDEFVNTMLVPLYHPTHSKLLKEITGCMNIRPSSVLNNSYDSLESGGSHQDDCSVSSFGSSMCGPDDSTSQHPHESSFNQHNLNNSQHSQNSISNSARTSLRTASFLSVNNPKRQLVMPGKPKIHHRQQSHSASHVSAVKHTAKSPKPKKVRRNLFDVQAQRDPKDMKMLLSLSNTNSPSFSRSPSLFPKSPLSKISSPRSPGRPSPFFAAARARIAKSRGPSGSSRRRLLMDAEDGDGEDSPQKSKASGFGDSPDVIRNRNQRVEGDVICPESPCTQHSSEKRTPGNSSGKNSATKSSVVQESPELVTKSSSTKASATMSSHRIGYRRMDSLNSLSFYSSDSSKSRAWARSGAKLLAAKIKDGVDLTKPFTLNDLEFFDPDDPTKKSSPAPVKFVTQAPTQSFIKNDLKPNVSSESIAFAGIESSVSGPKNSPAGLDTPSKRVQFTVGLVSTPSPTTPAKSTSATPVTPKSILKDAGNTHT